ncbi:MAG: DUF4160 domain-containing protein [Chitinivibrionia bacterium]|nr:DUF4160 domain-containing protein [Chitinivibrionia bacterium]
MPEISRFLGILIKMNYSDHLPPHFHAEYGNSKASFDLEGNIIKGDFPPKQTKFVGAWALLHDDELFANWELAKAKEELLYILPLRRD